jgi:phosphoglycerate mutase family protein
MDMTVLYLVRHGETVDNARHIMQGQTQGQLNDNGIRQAEEVAERMKKEQIDAFVSSDLRRSIHTCEIIAQPHNASVVTTPLLRERDWGAFTGKYIPDLSNLNDPTLWPNDIESLDAMKVRAKEFLAWIRKTYPGQRVLAVGHGIINKAIQSVFFDKPMKEIPPMTNAEIRILDLD